MNPSDYTGCDIDKMQLEDNENYQNRYHNKSVKDYSSDVGKGPENIADLLKTKSSKEWIVDSFGARGSCVLLAGDQLGMKAQSLIVKGDKALAAFLGLDLNYWKEKAKAEEEREAMERLSGDRIQDDFIDV